MDSLTVGEVASKLGVTVRTLHHYDAIGLLRPSGRTAAGYRLYTPDDLARLQSIVVYRRLGFSLDEIAELLAHPGSAGDHLRRQRGRVLQRLAELGDLLTAINRALEREMDNRPATIDDIKELFGDGYEEAATEAREQWGDTDAWKESQRRTTAYTKADWAAIKAEQAAIHAAYIGAMEAGEPPHSARAMGAAEMHRRYIDARFYDCPPEVHRGLADLYVSDSRFTAAFDELRAGLARYVRDAIQANADRQAS